MEIRNIFCVGRNYTKHAQELGNEIPDRPLIFMKPTSSIVYTEDQPIKFPNHQGDIHYEMEIALYIGKDVTHPVKVDEVVTKMAMGIDFTLRDVQSTLKEKGHPWLLAKGFPNAALLTNFWDFPGQAVCEEKEFTLIKNKQVVQKGQAESMIFDFENLIDYLNEHFGLKKGDVIFTGTPEGVGPINDGDEFELRWDQEAKGTFTVER